MRPLTLASDPRYAVCMRFSVGLTVLLTARTVSAQAIDLEGARRVLPPADDCADVPCLLEHAYRADPKAQKLALALWQESGSLAGLGQEERMDGGFRGEIHLIPQLPVAGYRRQLSWVMASSHAIDHFFSTLFAERPTPAYRWRSLTFRFVRSIDKHRPSAYASDFSVTYNVEGSLLISEAGVRETLFHEVFHLNDDAHGDWSGKHLRAGYDAILAACGSKPSLSCLAPFAPNDTRVRGGTYYAFQQNNGDTVHEYAAELAVRYFKEQSEMLARGKLTQRAFKCGKAQNAQAWRALVDEFFGGRDLVPGC